MEVLPDRHHHLFEPATAYHEDLETNYKAAKIDYTLHKKALSDTNGVLYLHNASVGGSGRVTHSQIRSKKDKNMPFLVKVERDPDTHAGH